MTPTEAQLDRLWETLRTYVRYKAIHSRLKAAIARDRHTTLPSGYDYLTDDAAIRRTLGEYPRDRYREQCRRAIKALDSAVLALFELEAALEFLELKGDGRAGRPRGTCSVDGCDGLHHAKGLCRRHWEAARAHAN